MMDGHSGAGCPGAGRGRGAAVPGGGRPGWRSPRAVMDNNVMSAEIPEREFLIAGRPGRGRRVAIHCPHDEAVVSRVHEAGPGDLAAAIEAAEAALPVTRGLPAARRAEILLAMAAAVEARGEELAVCIALEAGKPIRQARAEVLRCGITLRTAAAEARRPREERLDFQELPGGAGRVGLLRRYPVGPIAAITPYNFPLNLVAHKLAPAIAAGCPVVLKPAPQAPSSALLLGEIAVAAGWPPGALSVLPLAVTDAAPLIDDPRLRMLTFTGSPAVGWALKARVPRKKVTLELGGNAGVIIHDDADLAAAAAKCAVGGFSYAGQSCIAVQRIFVSRAVHDAFLGEFLPRVRALVTDHPLSESADLCALISAAEAARVAEWLEEARHGGARVLCGGRVHGHVVEPTVLAGAAPEARVNAAEVFAPVVTVAAYDTFDEALARVNAGRFGLQAGVFTRDRELIARAFDTLEVGGVMIDETPTWRLDPMPYGGVKDSGFGREGVRWAIEEMTEPRLLALPADLA